MIRPPPRSTPFPTRRSSDLQLGSGTASRRFTGHAHNGRRAGVLLKAATVAAGARRTVRFYGHVPGLAGHAGHAMPHASVQHNAAPDAGSLGKHEKAVVTSAGAQPELAHGSRIGVVIEHD